MLTKIRTWWLRRHLDRRHGFAVYSGDKDSLNRLLDEWMATAELDQLVQAHHDDHGTYRGGGGRDKHNHLVVPSRKARA